MTSLNDLLYGATNPHVTESVRIRIIFWSSLAGGFDMILLFMRNYDTPDPQSTMKTTRMTSLQLAFQIHDLERTSNIELKSWRRKMKTAVRKKGR